MAYSHHRVALFGKKASQERLASRISALLDITLNDDDGLPNLMCAKCKRRVESLENHTWDRKPLKGLRNRLLKMKIQTFITRHYIILTSLLYRVRTLTSHDTEESENSPESPHLGEIKRMRKQCVPGASPFFARAGDEAKRGGAEERTALMLGKRIEELDSVLIGRVDSLVMVEVLKWWEKRKELDNPNPCTPRTSHPPTKEQSSDPSESF